MAAIINETKMSAEVRELLEKAKSGLFSKGDAEAQLKLAFMFAKGQGVVKDERQAAEWCHKAAEQGYPPAQFKFAQLLAFGTGVAKDEGKAAEWFRKAAEQKHAKAQYYLGCMYADGRGITKDERQAVEWFRNAAELGNAEAQCQLGARLANGPGVETDLKQAVEWFRKAAEQGDAFGQFNLGVMFENSRGIAKDEWQASEWYRKAAEQGLAEAQFNLGVILADGRGFLKIEWQAVKWLRKAAEQGLAKAQYYLGVMLDEGRGVMSDEKQAAEWFRKAADQGEAAAKYYLGCMFGDGRGVAKDEVEWLRKAAEQEHARAQYYLGLCLEVGEGVTKDERQAVDWYRKAAEQGNASAQVNLAFMFLNGRGVTKDEQQAVKWYSEAAEQGHTIAQFNLGLMLGEGLGIPKDEIQAVEWYRKAAEQGHAKAQCYFATALKYGNGVEQDLQQSLEYFHKAAKQNDDEAQYHLGLAFENGLGVEKDFRQATEWYRKAAELGNAEAQCHLGARLANGQGVEKDLKQAAEWFRKAAEQGIAEAQFNLGVMFENGQGVIKDKKQAMVWYEKAAEQGDDDARDAHVKMMVEDARDIAKKILESPIAIAQKPSDIKITASTSLPDRIESSSEKDSQREEPKVNEEIINLQKDANEGNVEAQFKFGRLYIKGLYNLNKDIVEGVKWVKKAAEQGYIIAQFNLGAAFEGGHGVPRDDRQAMEWYQKAAEQGHIDAQSAFDRLQSSLSITDTTISSTRVKTETATIEAKEKQESITREHYDFIEGLRKSGLSASHIEQLNKNLTSPLSAEEFKIFATWKEDVTKSLVFLQHDLSETHRELGRGPEIKNKYDFIKTRPKLLDYQKRLEKEFGYFASCYSLAPAGLFQLEDNKKDAMISAMSSIPQATIEGIPIVGSLVGKLFGLIPKGLKFANKKHRMKQMNRIKELFGGISEICKIAYLLSLELTLAKQSEIEVHEKMEYEGLAKIKGLYELGKETVMKQWKDLTTSDTTGVKLKPTEELAIRDCAFIMQQVSAEEVSIDSTKELISQLVEIATGKPYKQIMVSLPPTDAAFVSPLSLQSSSLALVTSIASPLSLTNSSSATLSDVETLKQLLMEQQEAARRHAEDLKVHKEALRRQQIEAEAVRAETKVLAEKLAKVQKQLQATDVDGGAEVLILEKPGASSSSTSAISYTEFHALKQQVTLNTQITEATAERMEVMSRTVYDLQDGNKTERKKTADKQITHARDRDTAETKQRQEEQRVQEARKSKTKRFITAKDLM